MKRPRVLLADDHRLLVEAFRRLIEPECDIVGTATNGRELLEIAPRLAPDVIILDIAMPLLNGLDAGERIKQLSPLTKLVFLTMNPDPETAVEAFRRGAAGYLLKTSAAEELLQAIRTVLRNLTFITPQLDSEDLRAAIRRGRQPASSDLTARQREVLQLLAEGRTMKEVARLLSLTPRTVAFHKYQIMERVRLKTNADLVQYAIKLSLVFPDRA